jgi:hypothetical protein
MRTLEILLLAFPVAVAGCARSGVDSSASASSTQVVSTHDTLADRTSLASSTAKSACPRTGLWAKCSLEKRLEQSGFVVHPVNGDSPRRAGFSVLPAVYNLGRSRLEVFLYSSQQSAARDASGLDTLTAAPRGSTPAWPMPPTFIRSANLIAIFLTGSPVQGERLTLALTAGPPQP